MKTLVIHPRDKSTDFLKPVYRNLKITLLTGNCSKSEVMKQVRKHHRIIMLGHGCPAGLFAVGQFHKLGQTGLIIDDSFAELLRSKKNNIYIWCHADEFVEHHGIKGFYTGMFISEDLEALYYDINPGVNEVEASNDLFSHLTGDAAHLPTEEIHRHVKQHYQIKESPVRDFNYERLYWR